MPSVPNLGALLTLETRSSPIYVTIPNLVALGLTSMGVSKRVQKILGTLGLAPPLRNVAYLPPPETCSPTPNLVALGLTLGA